MKPQPSPHNFDGTCLCAGAANVDMRCLVDENAADGLSNPAAIDVMAGGAALNTARIIALNAVPAAFTGPVGSDSGAEVIAAALRDSGVKNLSIAQNNESTGRYVAILNNDGSLKIACNDMQIHDRFDHQDLAATLTTDVIQHISSVFVDANLPASTIKHLLMGMADKLRCATTVSPAKAPRLGPSLNLLDVVFTNVAEAASLLQTETQNTNPRILAMAMANTGVPRGVISNGAKDVWFWQDGNASALPVTSVSPIVDVVGAGDALAGGTIAALHKGASFVEAVRHGISLAANILQIEGPAPKSSPRHLRLNHKD